MERLPTVHVGKKGAVAKGRASLNVRLRAKNAQVLALDEQIGKLIRMRARLAAWAEPTPDLQRVVRDVEETVGPAALATPQCGANGASTHGHCGVDRAS